MRLNYFYQLNKWRTTVEVNINGNELEVNGKTKMLTHAGMAIFKHLYKSSPKVVKACGIQTHLRSISRTSINQQISHLRQSLMMEQLIT